MKKSNRVPGSSLPPVPHHHTTTLGGNRLRALRLIYLISSLSLFIVVGFCVQSFIGVAHVGYCPLPREGELAPEFEWHLVAEAGSVTLIKIPYIRYLDFGFDHGFSKFGEGGVVGDGGAMVSRLIGRFRFRHCAEHDNFYGIPCQWIGSVPFWLPTLMLSTFAILARRLYDQTRSGAQSGPRD